MCAMSAADTAPAWRLRGAALPLDAPRIMGVINVTPDSFFDGGKLLPPGSDRPNVSVVVRRARQLVEAGADLLDVGGESTRPGAEPVAPEREAARVVPVIRALREAVAVPLSVDTRHASVAEAGLAAGAALVNDVSCLADAKMAAVVARAEAGLVISHLRGEPRDMQASIHFDDVLGEVAGELAEAVARAEAAGVARASILVDPGIGFGKTAEQSAALVCAAGRLRAATGCEVLIGASRKSFLGALADVPVAERALASVVAAVLAVDAGARVVRVHDVAETAQALRVAAGIRAAFRVAAGASPPAKGPP